MIHNLKHFKLFIHVVGVLNAFMAIRAFYAGGWMVAFGMLNAYVLVRMVKLLHQVEEAERRESNERE